MPTAVMVAEFAGKFATPATAVTVNGPPISGAPPGSLYRPIETLPVNWAARLPYWSSATMPRPKSSPAAMVLGGWTITSSFSGAAGSTLNELDVAGSRLLLLAWMV